MNAKYLLLAVAAIMVASTMFVVVSDSDNPDAASVDGMYELSYFGEVDGSVVVDYSYAVTGGKNIYLYSPVNVDGYTFMGWKYNGELYEVGDVFVMPNENATLVATWEGEILSAESQVPEESSFALLIFVALMAIAAIVCGVVIQSMRTKALKNI